MKMICLQSRAIMKKNWAERFDEEQDELAERIARNREITRLAEEEKAKREAEEQKKVQTTSSEPLPRQVGWLRPDEKVGTFTENYSFFDDETERE